MSGLQTVLDSLTIDINGDPLYTDNIEHESFTITSPADSLSVTATMRVWEADEFLEGGNSIAAGNSVRVTATREDVNQTGDTTTLFLGNIIDKIAVETGEGTVTPNSPGSYIELNLADRLYQLDRTQVDFAANSQTISKQGYLFFKDDGSGAGAPSQYTRKAELRVFEGGLYFVPFEDMDNVPLHSLRRKATGTLAPYRTHEHSVYSTPNDYKVQYQKKELVFNTAQLASLDSTAGGADTTALPDSATPAPNGWFTSGFGGLGTNQGWTYRWVASFFVAPPYPTRNTSPHTIENIWRDIILTGDPLSDAGGAGYTTADLQLQYAFDKGSPEDIRDRLDEGMLVTAYTIGSDTLTVSDGDAWIGSLTLTYTDVQGVNRSYDILSLSGNDIQLTAVPTGILAGVRVHGCAQLGIIVTLTGAGETTAAMVNYTDIEIDGTRYFIREIRDATTLVVVNVDETGDFSALPASGTLTYFTIEYTGLQIRRLNWDKTKGTIADFLQYCHKNNLVPINWKMQHEPNLDIIRARQEKQYRGLVTVVAGASITVDNADGFYPGQPVVWYDTVAALWTQTTVDSLDFSADEVVVFTVAPTGLAAGAYIYANCRIPYGDRTDYAEHSFSLEDAVIRAEVVSTANQATPLLSKTSSSVLAAAPSNAGLPGGSWVAIVGDASTIVDGSVNSMYLLRWVGTGSGLFDGDPEEFNMTPIPWELVRYELDVDPVTGLNTQDVEEILLDIGYSKDMFKAVADGYRELPIFTVEASTDEVAVGSATNWAACCSELVAKTIDPLNNAGNQVVFKCDLLHRFRHVRLLVDRPFLYKVKENSFGTPTRARDVPVLIFNVYKKPDIRYTAADEGLSQDQSAPGVTGALGGQITPYIGSRPFAQLTDKGADINSIAGAGPYVLTVPSGHFIEAADTVEFWDTSAAAPFSGANSTVTVSSTPPPSATTITLPAIPAGLVAGDKIGGLRRWMLDATDSWRDLLAKDVLAGLFSSIKPCKIVQDESAQNGWDAQQIAVVRLYENFLTVKDGRVNVNYDPFITRYSQVVGSRLFAPHFVAGVTFSAYEMSLAVRSYNSTLQDISAGGG